MKIPGITFLWRDRQGKRLNVIHVTKFALTEFFTRQEIRTAGSFYDGFTRPACRSVRHRRHGWRTTLRSRRRNRVNGVFQRDGIKDFHTINIQNHVAVIRDHVLTVLRTPAQLHQLTSNRAARHRNHFDRQRNLPRISTCLEASAIQINFSATEAIIFSRVNAAPPRSSAYDR